MFFSCAQGPTTSVLGKTFGNPEAICALEVLGHRLLDIITWMMRRENNYEGHDGV